ncbi:putative terpene synthase 2 [Senna tora]|uniref:Putative terpene synthase 2 n=1 Tax=Senna tora TaxID=362788 RepID=A0A834TKR9_9FABA|nr:putative terpene synthase 2 [Senna tora]
MAEAYLVEAKWCNEGHIPTYEEYIENGVIIRMIHNVV